jgi:hypothetical protein
MKRLIVGGLAALAIGAGVVPAAAQADPGNDCCEHEFDSLTPYVDALKNHGLGYLLDQGIPVALAARDVCLGISALGTAVEWSDYLTPTQAEQVANAMYDDVCPEMEQ